MRAILIPLSAAEEIALRKVHLGSSAIAPDLMARLKALALIERTGGGWRLTPLGMRRHDELADVPLRGRGPPSSTTSSIATSPWRRPGASCSRQRQTMMQPAPRAFISGHGPSIPFVAKPFESETLAPW